MKVYLRIIPNISARVTSKHVAEYKHALEWGEISEATLDYCAAAEVTQQQLKEIGIDTELVEVPQPRDMESKWAISKDA
jgi:hypothetical protein